MLALENISQKELVSYGREFGVPDIDCAMIAMNAVGARCNMDLTRARMDVRPTGSSEDWQLILALDSPDSPFSMNKAGIFLGEDLAAEMVRIENDDVVLSYLRKQGRALTLNTYSRSACTGCTFCPNVIEESADGTLKQEQEFAQLFKWICKDNGWKDLSHVDAIAVCSGCFHNADAAIDHLKMIRSISSDFEFAGRLHLLSSVIRERRDLERAARELGAFHLTLTLECFTRRDALLKSTKASLTFEDTKRILDDCCELGILGDFTYIVGLDDLESTVDGLVSLSAHVSTFPRIQIFQAHNGYMRSYRNAQANNFDYYFNVRDRVGDAYFERGFQPETWENYRSLWYTEFKGRMISGPRI